MSTLESFTRTTTALGLGLLLAACSGPAPIDGASHAAQAPGTKGDLTQLSASASTSDQPSDGVATDKPLQAPATDQELAMDDAPAESPATNLRDEEKVGWNDKKREPKSSEHSDVPWPDTTGYEVVSDKQLRIYFEDGHQPHAAPPMHTGEKAMWPTMPSAVSATNESESCPAFRSLSTIPASAPLAWAADANAASIRWRMAA